MLIRQYLETERILRNFFDTYTLSVCIGHCVETKTGPNCCEDQDYRVTEIHIEPIGQDIMTMRSAEYRKVSSEGCGYLSPHGCILKKYRSPICNTFVCEALEDYFNILRFGSRLKEIEKWGIGIFKGFPESQEEKIAELERIVSTLSHDINIILPPDITLWQYVRSLGLNLESGNFVRPGLDR